MKKDLKCQTVCEHVSFHSSPKGNMLISFCKHSCICHIPLTSITILHVKTMAPLIFLIIYSISRRRLNKRLFLTSILEFSGQAQSTFINRSMRVFTRSVNVLSLCVVKPGHTPLKALFCHLQAHALFLSIFWFPSITVPVANHFGISQICTASDSRWELSP